MKYTRLVPHLVAPALLIAGSLAAASTPAVEVGHTSPPLQLPASDGSTRALGHGEGPTVLIFFRGLW
jgi:hypothetical protein